MSIKNDDWFKSWFNTQYYLDLYKHRDEHDARRIVSLVFRYIKLKKGSRVLDLACGNGRHSILFAKRGLDVTGIDLSKYLISQARKKLSTDYSEYKNNLKFEIRDMRDLKHVSEFDLVVNIFTSFGYFERDSDNERVIGTAARALREDGCFLIDFLNRDYVKKHLIRFDIKRVGRVLIVQIRTIRNGFVEKDIIIFSNRRAKGGYPLYRIFKEKIKLYSLDDFEKMFRKCGLNILRVFGSYTGDSFVKNKSERLIILARKKT